MATPGGAFLQRGDALGAPLTRIATGARQHVPIYMSQDMKDEEEDDDEEEIDIAVTFGVGVGVPPIKKKMEKAKWSASEDTVLKRAVEQHDGKNWKLIASYLEGKTEVQCLHRWTKVLNPNLTKGPWTEEVG